MRVRRALILVLLSGHSLAAKRHYAGNGPLKVQRNIWGATYVRCSAKRWVVGDRVWELNGVSKKTAEKIRGMRTWKAKANLE